MIAILPPQRAIVLGYYDGPTEGLLISAQSEGPFYFEMLAWDDQQDVRVYRLAPVNEQLFLDFEARLNGLHSPDHPVWVPLWGSLDETIRVDLNEDLARLKSTRGAWAAVFASATFQQTIACKPWPGDEVANRMTNWFHYLGMP